VFREDPTGLVTGGVFRISRNPIFLGMRLNLQVLLYGAIPNIFRRQGNAQP